MAVACFYFDFGAREEQQSTDMLGAPLKQVVSGLREVLGEIVQADEYLKNVRGDGHDGFEILWRCYKLHLRKKVHSYEPMP